MWLPSYANPCQDGQKIWTPVFNRSLKWQPFLGQRSRRQKSSTKKMRWKKRRSLSILLILLSFMSDPSDATRRHRREGDAKEPTVSKKKKKEDTCVYGYCLDPTYNSLELPSKVTATHIKMNLEVRTFLQAACRNRLPWHNWRVKNCIEPSWNCKWVIL